MIWQIIVAAALAFFLGCITGLVLACVVVASRSDD